MPRLLSLCSGAPEPSLLSPRVVTAEVYEPTTCLLQQEKPPQWEDCAPQLEKSQQSNEENPAQPINKQDHFLKNQCCPGNRTIDVTRSSWEYRFSGHDSDLLNRICFFTRSPCENVSLRSCGLSHHIISRWLINCHLEQVNLLLLASVSSSVK